MKYLTETVTEEQLIEHIEFNNGGGTRLESLIGALVGILVDVPLKDFTYPIQLEAVTCLLVLLSVQVHTGKRADHSNIYQLIMRGKHAIHAPLLIKSLLQNFIEQKKSPPGFTENQGNSIVLGKCLILMLLMRCYIKLRNCIGIVVDVDIRSENNEQRGRG